MKAQEFLLEQQQLDEGPLDFMKKVGAGAKGLAQGGFSGAKLGWDSKKQEIDQADQINAQATDAAKNWATTQQTYRTLGRSPTPGEMRDWLKDQYGLDAKSSPASMSPVNIKKWIAKEIARATLAGTPIKTPGASGVTGPGTTPVPGDESKPGVTGPGTPPVAPKPAIVVKPAVEPRRPESGSTELGPGETRPGFRPGPGSETVSNDEFFRQLPVIQAQWRDFSERSPRSIKGTRLENALREIYKDSKVHIVEYILQRRRNKLMESFHKSMTSNPYYMMGYRSGRKLMEAYDAAGLTQDEIREIFRKVADGAAAGRNVDFMGDDAVSNRTMLGSFNDSWEKIKDRWQKKTLPAALDASFDSMQRSITNAFGEDSKVVQAVDWYKNFALRYPALRGLVLASVLAATGFGIASAGGGAISTMSILAGLRALDSVMSGDKLTTALYKAAKGAAAGAALNWLTSKITGDGAAPAPGPDSGGGGQPSPFPPDTGGGQAEFGLKTDPEGTGGGGGTATSPETPPEPDGTGGGGGGVTAYTVRQGDGSLSEIAERFKVSVADLKILNPELENADVLRVGQTINIPPPNNSDVYAGGVGTAADTLNKIRAGLVPDSPISQAAAARAGLLNNSIYRSSPALNEAIVDYTRIKNNFLIQESLRLPTYSAVYITQYGVSKIFERVEELSNKQQLNEAPNWLKGLGRGIEDVFRRGADALTNKVSYDKLDLNWRRNFTEYSQAGSVELPVIIDFLRNNGIKDGLIKEVMDGLGLPFEGGVRATEELPNPDDETKPDTPVTPDETKPDTPVTPDETKPVTPDETKPVTPDETKPVTPVTPAPAINYFDRPNQMLSAFEDYIAAGGKFKKEWRDFVGSLLSAEEAQPQPEVDPKIKSSIEDVIENALKKYADREDKFIEIINKIVDALGPRGDVIVNNSLRDFANVRTAVSQGPGANAQARKEVGLINAAKDSIEQSASNSPPAGGAAGGKKRKPRTEAQKARRRETDKIRNAQKAAAVKLATPAAPTTATAESQDTGGSSSSKSRWEFGGGIYGATKK